MIVIFPLSISFSECPHPVYTAPDGTTHCYFLFDHYTSLNFQDSSTEMCILYDTAAIIAELDTTEKMQFLIANSDAIFGTFNGFVLTSKNTKILRDTNYVVQLSYFSTIFQNNLVLTTTN